MLKYPLNMHEQLSILKPTANWSPYNFTLVQKVKHRVYKIQVFFKVKQYFAEYGSLYVTLCFVLCRFDFGVLTFYFRILSFLLCVLCTILFI